MFSLLDLLFPKRCVGCGKVGLYICNRCVNTIRPFNQRDTICPVCEKPALGGMTHSKCRMRYSPDGLWSAFHYTGVIRNFIHVTKYRLVRDLSSTIAGLIVQQYMIRKPLPYDNPTFVPIPLHKTRLHERGFNQADEVGRRVAEQLEFQYIPHVLIRSKPTTPQVIVKNRKDRLENMKGVFIVSKQEEGRVKDADVIVFDDVFTTGATARAASESLKRSGAKSVWIMTIAR